MELDYFHSLKNRLQDLNFDLVLSALSQEFPRQVVFSTSFSMEDQAITHLILSNNLPIEIFTLDTGRLFSETYDVWMRTNQNYHTHIKCYCPNQKFLQEFQDKNGCNAFYNSIELRKKCCYIRKVEPLQRALKGCRVWVTGLRKEHSKEREGLPKFEWDKLNGIAKYHPLLDWSGDRLKKYIDQYSIPYNKLHDEGYVSIGCAPCTRAVQEGEDFRSGRWWWEDTSKKECGLHWRNS